MLTIDGRYGEGGGQILRTSIALSALKGTPCTITHIRANRPTPGLKAQHLMGLKAAAEICHAQTKGLNIGSTVVEFIPGRITGGNYTIEVGTAGSVTLILQVLVPICVHAEDTVSLTITGGTDVKWSPSSSYFEHVFCSFLEKMNVHIQFTVEKYGFYPRGGGRVKVVLAPWEKKSPLSVIERGNITKIDIDSVASTSLEKARVAERQSEAFLKEHSGSPGHVRNRYADTLNPGSSFCALAYCENSVLGVDSLGERGKSAERVGGDAASLLKREIASKNALDVHMGDQIIPYIALAGGEVSVSSISEHTKTSIWVCHQFLDTEIAVSGNVIKATI